jgi:hypothetical protein
MQIVPPHYLVPSRRHAIIDALAPLVQSWFADTLSEPIPEKLAAILRRMDAQPIANGLHRKKVLAMHRANHIPG